VPDCDTVQVANTCSTSMPVFSGIKRITDLSIINAIYTIEKLIYPENQTVI
jgi:hypothetical protein